MTGHRSRQLENIGFAVGLAVLVIYVLAVEVAPQFCYAIGKCANQPQHHEFPWAVFWTVSVCIAPKMLGRVSAGKVWNLIGSRTPAPTFTDSPSNKPDADGTVGGEGQA